MRLRVVSEGTGLGTKVFDADTGAKMLNVERVTLEVSRRGFGARVELSPSSLPPYRDPSTTKPNELTPDEAASADVEFVGFYPPHNGQAGAVHAHGAILSEDESRAIVRKATEEAAAQITAADFEAIRRRATEGRADA